jgi:hypothetical protein
MLPKAMGAAHSGRNNEAIFYHTRVKPSSVDKTKQAIERLVHMSKRTSRIRQM